MTGDAEADVCIGIENILGSTHSDILVGNSLRNVISGGRGHDILVGAAGRDVFSYRAGDGDDVIADFTTSLGEVAEHDTIRFVGTRLKTFADVAKYAVQVEAGVVIEVGRSESVTLVGVKLAALRASDFEFH
ncbi:MAG TPA: hypothetical protein VHG30_18720 [Microvirga sp.]|nr:hypothetical protein [Microvirga sp.]